MDFVIRYIIDNRYHVLQSYKYTKGDRDEPAPWICH